jgi:uncharacterized protein
MNEPRPFGTIFWRDLTVPNAESGRDFYFDPAGRVTTRHEVDGCDNYDIRLPESGEVIAGICHARGENARSLEGKLPERK